jgi:uncharacterized membrane protein
VLLLAAVLLAGAWLRLNNIATESVWWDEFSSLVHLAPPAGYEDSPHFEQWQRSVIQKPAGGLFDFWQANRTYDPATMPLYYSVEYFAWNYCGRSVLVLRLVSFLIGMAALPLLYLLGRHLFGPRAGLLAMALLALSPVHAQFSQEIRMYGLFTLLALASAYTFCRVAAQGGGRWWAAHLGVNVLLLWTHPFAVWIPLVQGLTLLAVFWDRPRRVVAWGVAHAMLSVPSALYISTIRFYGTDSTNTWMIMPNAWDFFGDLFGDDFVGMTYQFWAKADTLNQFFPEPLSLLFVNAAFYVGMALSGLFIVMLALAARAMLGRSPQLAGPGADLNRRWLLFLLLWAFLPPLILLGLSLGWRPMIQPRYTLHCSLALYLLVSAGVVSVRAPWLRGALAGVLLLGYGYQHALIHEGPYRTDWRGASRHIQAQGHPEDLILVHDWLWKRVFAYNFGPAPNVISYGGKFTGQEFDTLAELCATWTELKRPRSDGSAEPRGLWVAIQTDYFNIGPILPFELRLKLLGLSWEYREFKGMQHVCLYQVFDDPAKEAPPYAERPLNLDLMKQLSDLAGEFLQARDYGTIAALHGGRVTLLTSEALRAKHAAGIPPQPENMAQAALAFEGVLARHGATGGVASPPVAAVDGGYAMPCCLNALFNENMRDAVRRHFDGEAVPWQRYVDMYRGDYPEIFGATLGPLARRLDAGLPVEDFAGALREIHGILTAFEAGDLVAAQQCAERAAQLAPDYGRAVLFPGLIQAIVFSQYEPFGAALDAALTADAELRAVLLPVVEAIVAQDFGRAEALLAPLLAADIDFGVGLYIISQRMAAAAGGAGL